MHGHRDTITEFKTFDVLSAMAEATDAKRLQDWVSHYMRTTKPGSVQLV
jgi:hypothetical protein